MTWIIYDDSLTLKTEMEIKFLKLFLNLWQDQVVSVFNTLAQINHKYYWTIEREIIVLWSLIVTIISHCNQNIRQILILRKILLPASKILALSSGSFITSWSKSSSSRRHSSKAVSYPWLWNLLWYFSSPIFSKKLSAQLELFDAIAVDTRHK